MATPSPFAFFLSSWRGGPWGAFSMGARHGIYCAGCCWALMGLSFVFGVMARVLDAVVRRSGHGPRDEIPDAGITMFGWVPSRRRPRAGWCRLLRCASGPRWRGAVHPPQ
jgi:Predicted metal-binding integral membrane protein (DUF2182)